MEGVSGAASVVAVIVFALSCTKTIHDTISRIKNGPKNIAETTSALEDLWKTLEQIRGLDAEFISVNANLRNVVQKCAADLKECENKIGCLRILPSNKIMGKVLKRVKTMLKQDDFQEMWRKIKWHVSALSLQLLSIQ
jgi:hypothetical protein